MINVNEEFPQAVQSSNFSLLIAWRTRVVLECAVFLELPAILECAGLAAL
jgi:hypothetical protein